MYIIQMSDLHINDNQDEFNKKLEITIDMLKHIKKKITNVNESILLCLCGDIIDYGPYSEDAIINKFKLARDFIEKIYDYFIEYTNFKIGLCAGNHDFINYGKPADDNIFIGFNQLNNLAKIHKIENYSEISYVQSFDKDNVDFIYVNSTFNGDHTKGNIDYKDLEITLRTCKNKNKILICHHTIMSMDEQKDNPSIINAAKLIQFINKYDIKAFMHGHTHGVDGVTIGNNNCAILGVGALFSNNHTDVNSQFNLYKYEKGIFTEAWNCRYNDDVSNTGSPKMTDLKINMLDNMSSNYFTGHTFSQIYEKLINKLEVTNTALYNVSLNGSFTYDAFKLDINKNFGDKNELGYTYSELAEMWQRTSCPNELWFNHGEYFVIDGKSGIENIINHLNTKKTSSRAILSTTNSNEFLTKSDLDYIPSFMTIQFGFDGINYKKLYINLNLRALEASRFLKINICEVLYLCQELYKEIKFDEIQLEINAFRVAKDENFKCFIKAKLDLIDKEELSYILFEDDYDSLCKMLKEKKESRETVIIPDSIISLRKTLEAKEKRSNNLKKNFKEPINLLNVIELNLKEITKLRSKNSISSEEEKSL